IFPDRCIVCDREQPGTTTKITDKVLTWWTLFFFFGGEKFTVHVPACRWCGRRLRLRYFVPYAISLVVFAMLVIWVMPVVRPWVPLPTLRTIVGIVLFVIAMSPVSFLLEFFPPAFDFDVDPDEAVYGFRDARYAEEFSDLNHTWQSVLR